MKFPESMKVKDRISYLERYILVHSLIYYELNESVISDKRFDKNARLLASKIEKYGPEKISKTEYGYVFYDFDGSTGFDLIGRLSDKDREKIERIARYVLRLYKIEHGGKQHG